MTSQPTPLRKTDVALVRRVVAALSDPTREEHTRAALKKCLAPAEPVDLKALLASAPLEDLDLVRTKDLGRIVEL